MTLLKGDDSIKKSPTPMSIIHWPAERLPEGMGISLKDGWYFGIGFGLAMAIAVPLILLLLGCIIGAGIVVLGGSIGALL